MVQIQLYQIPEDVSAVNLNRKAYVKQDVNVVGTFMIPFDSKNKSVNPVRLARIIGSSSIVLKPSRKLFKDRNSVTPPNSMSLL